MYESDKPVWGANYYGFFLAKDAPAGEVFSFLRDALIQEDQDILPVRGPATYTQGAYEYRNDVRGMLTRFSGTEEIYIGDKCVYRCLYHGGDIT